MLLSYPTTMGQAMLALLGLLTIAGMLAIVFDWFIFRGSLTKATSPTGSTKATPLTSLDVSQITRLYIPAGDRYLLCQHRHAHRFLPSCPLCAQNGLTGFGRKDWRDER